MPPLKRRIHSAAGFEHEAGDELAVSGSGKKTGASGLRPSLKLYDTQLSNAKLRSRARTRILMADDHPSVREGIARNLGLQSNLLLCCRAGNAEEALAAMSACNHDLAIVDMSIDGGSGLALIKILRQSYPRLAILTLSLYDDSLFAERALRSGANGYLRKQEGIENIVPAIRQVLAGKIYLSTAMRLALSRRLVTPVSDGLVPIAGLNEKELEILHLIGLGLGTGRIAEKLNRSVKTVEKYRASLKKKLQRGQMLRKTT